MKYLIIICSLFFFIGCSSIQIQDKYANTEKVRHYHERGCYNMEVKFDEQQAYVSECGERSIPQSYITGFTLGIVDLSAAEYKFENALLDYLKEQHKLTNCKIYRTNVVEMMSDTLGVEAYYECDNKPSYGSNEVIEEFLKKKKNIK